MKKFLSILLALAVGFTFTFGSAMSAFAATTNSLNEAQNYVDNAVNVANGQATLNADYCKTALDYATAESKNAAQLILSDLTSKYNLDDETEMNSFKAEFSKWALGSITPPTYIGKGSLAFAKTSYLAYFNEKAESKDIEARLAEAKTQINAIDTTVFSGKTYNVSGVDYTYKTYAEKLIKDYTATLSDEITLFSGITDYADKKAKINTTLYGVNGTKANPTGGLYLTLYGNKTTKGLLTVEEEKEQQGTAVVDVEHAKAELAYKAKVELYNQWKVVKGDSATAKFGNAASWATNNKIGDITVYDATNKKIFGVDVANLADLTAEEAAAINAVIMEALNKTIEVANVYFDELEITEVGTNGTVAKALALLVSGTDSDVVIDKALKAIDKYNAAEKVAATKKDAVMFDGSKKYNDADIDEALAKDKKDIYANFMNNSWVGENNLGKVISVVDPVANAIAEAEGKFISAIITAGKDKTAEADKKYCRNYYDEALFGDGYDKVESATKASLNEAKTIEEVNSIMTDADAKLAKLRTKAERDAIDTAEYAKYETAINNYAAQVMQGLKGSDYRTASFNDIVKKYIGAAVGMAASVDNAGKIDLARNIEEVKALYDEAKKDIDNVISDAELKAEAAKVAETIAKLPATVDKALGNEDQFTAAYDAYKAYLELPGSAETDITGYLVFKSKMTDLKNYQKAAVEKAVKTISDPVTLADKDAVKAASDMYSKYSKYYKQYDETFMTKPSALTNAETAVYNAEVAAVKQMILKLTDASTVEDIAAAKAAYEALSGSQQRMVNANLGEYAYKLDLFEKDAKWTAEDAKAYVQDLAIAVRTAKVGKKVKVTVNADVQTLVDNGFTVEYKFYKSTKKGSGYKNTVNKTANTYTNTNPVKGKNYYKVKLVVKNADGAVVATTPLTQCKYGVRTIK